MKEMTNEDPAKAVLVHLEECIKGFWTILSTLYDIHNGNYIKK